MKKNQKIIRNIIIFVLLIILTFVIAFKDQDINEMFEVVKMSKKGFIFIGILCMGGYILCESINTKRTLKILKEKTSIFKTIKYSLIGFFFSAITPAASGGQPMQVYYMYKDKIPVAHSTLCLLINLSCLQIVTITTGIFGLALNYKNLSGNIIGFFIFGLTLNIIALITLIISIFSRRMTNWIIKIVIKILKIFRIKNLEEKEEKIKKELYKYQGSAKYIKENIRLILKTLLTTYLQYIFYFSTAYWVYRALGLNQKNIIELISLQALLYTTVAGIPSPGAVGVSEGGFMAIFSNVFSKNTISGAMVLNRGINFYLLVFVSAIVTVVTSIIQRDENVSVQNIDEIVEKK